MRLAFLFALALCGTPASADVTMPAIFGDGVVLQRNKPVAIWGRAEAGESITVSLGAEKKSVQTGADGHWILYLDARPVGAPLVLKIQGHNALEFKDVLFGEVWIGAGQSNMGYPVRCCRPRADHLKSRPNLRLYKQLSWRSNKPEWKGEGTWIPAGEQVVREFSASLFFTGLELYETLEVPVGLIQASLGGTRIESWTSAEVQFEDPILGPHAKADDAAFKAFNLERDRADHEKRAVAWDRANPNPTEWERKHLRPRGDWEMYLRVGNIGGLFNGKIAPLVPYTIRGVVWYQGENNLRKPELYQRQLTHMIRDWRKRWGQGSRDSKSVMQRGSGTPLTPA